MIRDLTPDGEYVPVPTRWLTDSSLTWGERAVLVQIIDAAGWQPFDPPDLTARLRVWTRPTDWPAIEPALRALTAAGYITRTGRHYRLATPEA